MKRKFKIYVDMDGVLADFDRHFENLFGKNPYDVEDRDGRDEFWKTLYTKKNFFRNIPAFKYLQEFWNEICKRSQHVAILTSPSRVNKDECIRDKQLWLKEKLKMPNGNPPLVIFESAKYLYACPNSILIDDFGKKIKDWENASGIGILHDYNDFRKTLEKLDKMIGGKNE